MILYALVLCSVYPSFQARGDSTATDGPASDPSPLAAGTSLPTSPADSNAAAAIDQQFRTVLNKVCHELSSARTVTYHAEITFDSVLPSGVKIQYAAAMDTAVQRPDHLAFDYKSDLGAKAIWYDRKTLWSSSSRLCDYSYPDSIDVMFRQVAEQKNLSIPLENLDLNDECGRA